MLRTFSIVLGGPCAPGIVLGAPVYKIDQYLDPYRGQKIFVFNLLLDNQSLYLEVMENNIK